MHSPDQEMRLARLAGEAIDAGNHAEADRLRRVRAWGTRWTYPPLQAITDLATPGVTPILCGEWQFPRVPNATLLNITLDGAWEEFAALRELNPGLNQYFGNVKEVVLGIYSGFNWDDITYYCTDYRSGEFTEQRALEKELGVQFGWVLSPTTMQHVRQQVKLWTRVRRRAAVSPLQVELKRRVL